MTRIQAARRARLKKSRAGLQAGPQSAARAKRGLCPLAACLDAHPAALWFAGFIVGPLLVAGVVSAAALVFSLPLLFL